MAVRSSRLAGPVQITGTGNTTLLTAESGETWLVKWLTLYNNDSVTHDVQVSITAIGTSTTVGEWIVPVRDALQIPLWWVVNGGEIMQIRHRAGSPAGQNTTVSVHGAELEGSAD